MARCGIVVWHLTERCNLTCPYCYARSSKDGNGITEIDYKLIADAINQLGPRIVFLMGGEPLLHDHLSDIITRISPSILKTLTTNGTLLAKLERAEEVVKGVNKVTISFDSTHEGRHDAMRGKGSFREALESALLVRQLDRILGIPFQLSTRSFEDCEDMSNYESMIEFAGSLGARSLTANFVEEIGHGVGTGLSIPLLTRRRIVKRLWELVEQNHPTMSLQVTSIYPFPELLGTFGKEASYGCLCGSGKVIIKADGGIVPCDVADYPADYLAQGFEIPRIPGYSIQEAYESELFKRYRDATTRFGRPECERCEYTDMCHSSCRTLAFKETGSLLNRGSLCFKANPG